MMKVAIVTFIHAYNYGAVFQGYALNRTINEMGIQCETLDYCPAYFREEYLRGYCGSVPRSPIKILKYYIKKTCGRKILTKRAKMFQRFINKNILLSAKQYESLEDINHAELDYDCYVAGSDQIWHDGCSRSDETYYLNFAQTEGKKRVSYAASFGTDLIKAEDADKYRARLKRFDAISVREQSGVGIIKTLLNRDAVVCCDPTMLLSAEAWKKLCDAVESPWGYILLYYVADSDSLRKSAEKLAREKNLPVICVPCNTNLEVILGMKDEKYKFDVRKTTAPEELLSLINNADYVLTNSFHGTVFSLIFRKQFMTEVVSENSRVNKRIAELLKTVDLVDQGNIQNVDRNIDWASVGAKLQQLQEKSKDYLMKVLME